MKYLQTKLKFALCVVNLLINATVIGGCIYEKQQYKTTIHRFNETKQQISETKQQEKEQLILQKEHLQNNTNTVETETNREVDKQVDKPVSLGNFKLTAYCKCKICCNEYAYNRPVDKNGNEIVYGAIGEELKEGYSIAVDPSVIPYRSKVIINGKVYEAQDCGGAIKGNRIDVYFEDHNDALEFGVQYAEVFVKM